MSERAEQSSVELSIVADLGHINLRGDANDETFLEQAGVLLGQDLPLQANTFTAGEHQVFWLGPDEWLIVSGQSLSDDLYANLLQSFARQHVSAVNLSGGQVVYQLQGAGVRELLSKGCTLDLHPKVFRSLHCAQSGLAKSAALIACLEKEKFVVIVRRSFAQYLHQWLLHTARSLS